MSRLIIQAEDRPGVTLWTGDDPVAMAARLAPIGVGFERWVSPVSVAEDADEATILALYQPYLDQLMGATGAGSADVLRMTPDHPGAAGLRARFLPEHRHTEAEIRFFVHGAGRFVLHQAGHVFDVHCTQGDLIHVPADIPHWFDAGPRPSFTVLRVFADTSGWVAHYTGDAIAARFQALDEPAA